MKIFFLYGILCTLSPISYAPECMNFYEDPKNYYTEKECWIKAEEKVNEIGANFTSKGFVITRLEITCLLDKKTKST